MLASTLVLAGCAAASGGGSFEERLAAQPTLPDLQDRTLRVLQRLQYEIDRTETEPQFMVITHWLERLPFDAEQEQGAESARNRIRVTGAIRGRTAITQTYTVTVRIENQIRLPDGGWTEAPDSDAFRTMASRIANDLDAELDQGIRRVGLSGPG